MLLTGRNTACIEPIAACTATTFTPADATRSAASGIDCAAAKNACSEATALRTPESSDERASLIGVSSANGVVMPSPNASCRALRGVNSCDAVKVSASWRAADTKATVTSMVSSTERLDHAEPRECDRETRLSVAPREASVLSVFCSAADATAIPPGIGKSAVATIARAFNVLCKPVMSD